MSNAPQHGAYRRTRLTSAFLARRALGTGRLLGRARAGREEEVTEAPLNGLPAKQIRARFHEIPTGSWRTRTPATAPRLLQAEYMDEMLAGIKADGQTIADVVAVKLNVANAVANCHEHDVVGDAEEPADEYEIEQEITV